MSTWQATNELRWNVPHRRKGHLQAPAVLEQKWVGHSHDVRGKIEWRPVPFEINPAPGVKHALISESGGGTK